jgi:hypothetical protein
MLKKKALEIMDRAQLIKEYLKKQDNEVEGNPDKGVTKTKYFKLLKF